MQKRVYIFKSRLSSKLKKNNFFVSLYTHICFLIWWYFNWVWRRIILNFTLEVASSSSDKAKLITANSTLDDNGHPFPTSPSHKTQTYLPQFMKSQDLSETFHPKKATGPDKNPVVVFKNISPALSPILANCSTTA